MHARIEHLLSLRDGEPVGAELVAHVRSCPFCTGELQRLSALRAEMQALPQFDPPDLAWERIRQTIPQRNAKLPPRGIGLAAAAAALVTLTVVALIARHGDQRSAERNADACATAPDGAACPPKVMNPAVSDISHLDELVAQSQQLEKILQTLPQRPRIERVSTAATIDTDRKSVV